ncbi:hypothetical protein ACIO8H_27750 [Streptomyces sp. NPDC087226]|uniref:hypothetical protein n=1 Tax=Streptomyces sp. NPDC087226 TaxID=3365771 RepID=UPI003801CA86
MPPAPVSRSRGHGRVRLPGRPGGEIRVAGRGPGVPDEATAPIGPPRLSPLTPEGGHGTAAALEPLVVPGSYVRVPGLGPGADAPAYAVAHAYRRFLDGPRDGTSRVPDFAHGVARHRGIASVVTEE